MFCGEKAKLMSDCIIKIVRLHLQPLLLQVGQVRKLRAYLRNNPGKVGSMISQHLNKLPRATATGMSSYNINDRLIGERGAHFVTMAPQHLSLMYFLRPGGKIARQPRLPNAGFTANEA